MTKHAISRVRHEPRRRLLTVQRVERITPHMARIELGGDLADFVSGAYDDHVKVFFPLPGQTAPTIPEQGPNGPNSSRRGRALAGARLHAAPLRRRAQ